ncbi:ATP phosphoribosyltransferase regulatory subunit [Candidatus Portiera aleyrodidarum]|uniref:ATP phosphoribosyltransferase regulatory subunit n=1 Tax=Candidatus Portiera aleyrodidarum MED (Bemisia tabaci) TaxID=1163752 RepID=A0AAU8SBN1_9GAMM|nr:ATP phosphoribosyltransferase regulatory subunit [Candidatus Portiera aleyrodidarum]AFQ24022.1 ATP phosphoribosyltransferase involved in histidine biosynthesis [Candidatus Portiera aleyrodidarum BT-B-HRs]AFS18786.1 ATP phosphoribosyltransferase regulatory subunit [Candidatus Portiera aleyrodidarum BT-QVLC]AFT80412.1 ATP phosphoribosyltransferase regulatory subunit [Candidatus Portiera aleyrodidarum BT-QVLC]AJF23999.1 ATP phosphoribosyltransferase [Candidatus Portiera aleyrodidarum MED (Bemis
MKNYEKNLLPDGIKEILPPQSINIENLRKKLLNLYYKYGYNLIIPPHIEFLETLLNVVGYDLELQTVKLIDMLSGKLIGLSADSTPQIARIDSNVLKNKGPYRVCYCTNVFRAFLDEDQNDLERTPIQVGIELLGYKGLEADIEIIILTIKSLIVSGAKHINLSVGHIGIYKVLVKKSKIKKKYLKQLFEAIDNKSYTDVDLLIDKINVDFKVRKIFKLLPKLHGDFKIIQKAYKTISYIKEIKVLLDELKEIYKLINKKVKNISIYFDLSDLKGYQYHNGFIFTAYVSGVVKPLAKGGRYDIGQKYGKQRPATGCTFDLNLLISLHEKQENIKEGILAPFLEDKKLEKKINELRFYGEQVIHELPGVCTKENNCNRKLCLIKKEWQIRCL